MPYVDTHCHLDHHFDLSAATQVARARGCRGHDDDHGRDRHGVARPRRSPPHGATGVSTPPWGCTPTTRWRPPRRCSRSSVASRPNRRSSRSVRPGSTTTATTPRPQQQEAAFRAHIELAKSTTRPSSSTAARRGTTCLAVLDDQGAPDRVVMHCFSGDARRGRPVRRSRAGSCRSPATSPSRTRSRLRDAAAAAPVELLLTETDSPYLTPHPHRGAGERPLLPPVHPARAGRRRTVAIPTELEERCSPTPCGPSPSPPPDRRTRR